MRKKTATLAKGASSTKPAVTAVAAQPTTQTKPAVTAVAAQPSPNGQPVSEEAIRLCAYGRWEAAGKPGGDGVKFWLDAEQELSKAM